MANIKSAKKRILTNDRQRAENRYIKATISTYVKNYRSALEKGDLELAKKELNTTVAYIDSACAKGVLHRNTASRKIARLNIALDKAEKEAPKKAVKVAEEKVEVKEQVVEETPVKKAPAKKAVTKKETTEKKAPAKKATKKETK